MSNAIDRLIEKLSLLKDLEGLDIIGVDINLDFKGDIDFSYSKTFQERNDIKFKLVKRHLEFSKPYTTIQISS